MLLIDLLSHLMLSQLSYKLIAICSGVTLPTVPGGLPHPLTKGHADLPTGQFEPPLITLGSVKLTLNRTRRLAASLTSAAHVVQVVGLHAHS